MTKPDKQQKRHALIVLGALFLGPQLGTWETNQSVIAVLLGLGLNYDLASWLATMASGPVDSIDLGYTRGPAETFELAEQAPGWRALYLIAAAERLMAGVEDIVQAKQLEQTYFRQHLYAEERRQRSAALVDRTAELNDDRPGESNLSGWRAVLDRRTTPECRRAHGKNFRNDKMPAIGWPGAVHVRCRCSSGPAIPGAPLLPSI